MKPSSARHGNRDLRKGALALAIAVAGLVAGILSASGHKQEADDTSGASFEKKLQEQLIMATPGTVIDLPKDHFHISRVLSLTVDNVTLRGKGLDKTVLVQRPDVGISGIAGDRERFYGRGPRIRRYGR
jgi:hypothetical protein